MNIVDSSGWLEYFADTRNARHFAGSIETVDKLVVPVITIYEVFKKVLGEKSEEAALEIAAHMRLGRVVNIDAELSLMAAKFSLDHGLPMADALIYATANRHHCTIWTQDEHFKGLDRVRYFPKV